MSRRATVFAASGLLSALALTGHVRSQEAVPPRDVQRVPLVKPVVPAAHQEPFAPQFLRLKLATFDPRTESPVPKLLAGTSNLWIVQLKGQPTKAWRRALAEKGATLCSYLPDYAYVVHFPAGSRALEKLPFVRWVGEYAPAFRLEPDLVMALMQGRALPKQRYNVVVWNKRKDKPALAARIAALGGKVDNVLEGSLLMEVSLNGAQLLQAAKLDEVLWIDRWAPPEDDMDNVRVQGGADHVEAMGGYSGAGIRGHVYEGVEFNHPDFNTAFTPVLTGNTPARHGHCTAGIVFGNGTSAVQARGMAPDAVGFFTNYSAATTSSRNAVIDAVVNTHNCMFTTASWGTGRTRVYTSISADADDVVFDHRIPWTQSQSNAGNQDSRPQAWAKNLFSIGAVQHYNNASAGDDSWAGGNGSTGPAADGRIKPDLCAYYDQTWTSDLTGAAGYTSGDSYTNFGGTSGATPIVAGHNALLIQMYTDGIFGNTLPAPGGTRFQNRPLAQTLKALQIVGARPYSFNASSTDNRREHQGWGFPSLQDLYDKRGSVYIVAEDDILEQGDTASHTITVAAGADRLKACMTFVEPAGNPSASLAIVNNLNLRVVAPNGTVYWGNNGLSAGNTSTAGGSSNNIDSVECVIVDNPLAGDWEVQVIAQSIVVDAHVATSGTDASYALAVIGGGGSSGPGGNVISETSFESGFDTWTNIGGDDLNWTQRSGSTPSTQTGPTAAQDGTFYAYVESSGNNTGYPNKTAFLQGPTLSMNGNEQMTFHYHMYGSSMGTLQLQAVSSGGAVTTLWSRAGDQGNSWLQQTVDLSSLSGTQTLRFFATTGTSYRSDFALDNIQISGGTPAAVQEGFEGGLVELTNESGDTHDWTQRSGSTPSVNTGPTGAAVGSNYAYVESSSPNIGTNARLSTQLLSFTGEESLSFRYHMYGASMGTLTVEAVSPGGVATALWTRSGDQGNTWFTANVSLASLSSDYRIRFNAQLGSSWQSDICIDEVSIGVGLSEDLEFGLNALTNETGDSHDWTRRSGSTPSVNTGPSGAAQGNWYAYVESSSPNIGTNAWLTSAPLNLVGGKVLTFRHHMYGASMGTLRVQAISATGVVTTLWSLSGDQGDVWQTAVVPISLTGVYRIRFDAQLGSSWQSDICIDDVSLK